jgi:hypothetical protein
MTRKVERVFSGETQKDGFYCSNAVCGSRSAEGRFFDKSKTNYDTNYGDRLLDRPIEAEDIPMISRL